MILQESPPLKHFGIQRKPLPLEPSVILREANRYRSYISAGNMSELFDGHPSPVDGISFSDSSGPPAATQKVKNVSMSRTFSSPGNFEGSIDRRMRLVDIFVAAEHALRNTISDPVLWKCLSSVEDFEQNYLNLWKAAANNYHQSWWKRHGVVLDG